MTPNKREELRRLAESLKTMPVWKLNIVVKGLPQDTLYRFVAFIGACHPAAVLDLLADNERLREFAYNFADVAEAAVRHHEWRAAGRQGQEVPFHGAFGNLPPSSVADLRKFAQAARRVLTQAGGGN